MQTDSTIPQSQTLPPAKADPSKAFFVDMLTKDIALSVCILDLIDNSIHSLIAESNIDVSEHLIAGTRAQRLKGNIDLRFSSTKFDVKDNCGGVSISDARNQIFLFGNPAEDGHQAGLGVYGIGMKRAFFKIGQMIAFQSHTPHEELRIDIDVAAWRKDDKDWSFPFRYARQKKSSSGGTDIEVTKLYPVVSEQFSSKAFKTILEDRISRAYALFLKAGLQIRVNGEKAEPDFPELAESKNLSIVRKLIKKDDVEILIMAGLSPQADKTPRGWYVFCNGRLVLDADKTEKTGWGFDSHPAFHSKFNHFLGYVYFRSKNVRSLPWTTTKDGIDRESPIYQAALDEMWIHGRPILNFLNDLYGDVREESEPERTLFMEAQAVTPQKVASRVNTTFEAKLKKHSDDDQVSIQYKRPNKKLKKIKEALGKSSMSASRIGEYTFDWYYDRNCK